MPLLDSFKVDHTKMKTPGIRLAKTITRKSEDKIYVYDLRFCEPNNEIMPERGIHTLEHLFAGFMRNNLGPCLLDLHGNNVDMEIIDISPMGCRTGFYMSIVSDTDLDNRAVRKAWLMSMHDVLSVKDESDIPELNVFQCGTYGMHSLSEAKDIASKIIESAANNGNIYVIDNEAIQLTKEQLNNLNNSNKGSI